MRRSSAYATVIAATSQSSMRGSSGFEEGAAVQHEPQCTSHLERRPLARFGTLRKPRRRPSGTFVSNSDPGFILLARDLR